MEKNYVSMLREVEKLRTALANSSGSDRRAGMVFPSFFFFFCSIFIVPEWFSGRSEWVRSMQAGSMGPTWGTRRVRRMLQVHLHRLHRRSFLWAKMLMKMFTMFIR